MGLASTGSSRLMSEQPGKEYEWLVKRGPDKWVSRRPATLEEAHRHEGYMYVSIRSTEGRDNDVPTSLVDGLVVRAHSLLISSLRTHSLSSEASRVLSSDGSCVSSSSSTLKRSPILPVIGQHACGSTVRSGRRHHRDCRWRPGRRRWSA